MSLTTQERLFIAAESLFPLTEVLAVRTSGLTTPKSYPSLLRMNCFDDSDFLWRASQISTYFFCVDKDPFIKSHGWKSCLASIFPVRDSKSRIYISVLAQLNSGMVKHATSLIELPSNIEPSHYPSIRDFVAYELSDTELCFIYPRDCFEPPRTARDMHIDYMHRIVPTEIDARYWNSWLGEWVLLGHSPIRLRLSKLDDLEENIKQRLDLWAQWQSTQIEALNEQVNQFADTLDTTRIDTCRKYELNYDAYNWMRKNTLTGDFHRTQAIENFPAFTWQIVYAREITKVIDRGISPSIALGKELGFSAQLLEAIRSQDCRQIPYGIKQTWWLHSKIGLLHEYIKHRGLPSSKSTWEQFQQSTAKGGDFLSSLRREPGLEIHGNT